MKRITSIFCAILFVNSSAFRTNVGRNQSTADLSVHSSTNLLSGDFYIHNECTFSINALAKNAFFSPVLNAKNNIASGDSWQPPNKLKTDFTVCVGFEFREGAAAGWELAKYGASEGAGLALTGVTTLAAVGLTGTAVGAVALGWSTTAFVGVGIVCPPCMVAGGLTASVVTIYGFASGIEMITDTIVNTISESAVDYLHSKKRDIQSGDTALPVYAFEGLMFPDDKSAQEAVSETILHWADHLQTTDRNIHWTKRIARHFGRGEPACEDEKDCVESYANRIYLPEGVAKAWADMLNSKFRASVWPALGFNSGEKHLYVRGGLSLPEWNKALGGWLVASYTPLFMSEEKLPARVEESWYAACTQIDPGMMDEFMEKCKAKCSESTLGLEICQGRCDEKLLRGEVVGEAGLGVCRGTYTSTRYNMLGTPTCCAAGPQTAADTEERMAFPKFCVLNTDCQPPEEGFDKHEGKWACAQAEVPKTNGEWENDKTCWQAPVVADAGKDTRNLLQKFPTWTAKDEMALM